MSITDELRRYISGPAKSGISHICEKAIANIADRIDVEHERELRETGEDIVQDVRHEWVRLPLDADNVPVHIGDVMVGEKIGGGFFEPFEVVGYIMSNGELEPMDKHKCPRKRKYLHHHHEPTVEDVLREFANRVCNSGHQWGLDAADTIAEFAAKLRLAGDAE